jgi:hypothetical protein
MPAAPNGLLIYLKNDQGIKRQNLDQRLVDPEKSVSYCSAGKAMHSVAGNSTQTESPRRTCSV